MVNFKNEYIDYKGNKYNIRNINLEETYDLNSKLCTFKTETKRDPKHFDNLVNGVFIYKSKYEEGKALRIYKDFADYKYSYHDDAKIVSKLQEIQKNIKLTDFPTGIVTVENYVIGQEIIYYENYKTLQEQINDLKNIKEILYYYNEMLNILEELSNNGIIYNDLHYKNFMVNNKSIKLIDFESGSFSFSNSENDYNNMVSNIRNLFNKINKILNLNFKIEDSYTIKEIKDEIKIKTKKL